MCIRDSYPDLLPMHLRMYARGSYAPNGERKALSAKVSRLIDEAGGMRPRGGYWRMPRKDEAPAAIAEAEQLRLL